MRADQLLLQRQLATSRSQAQRLIGAGVVWRAQAISASTSAADAPWKRIAKNSDDVPEDAHIELLDSSEARYVSRGGLKLEGALRLSGVSVTGKICLDVGQSTGGFTDCLLQHGAKFVAGVDVGSGQLHPSLREHAQVLALEHINARELNATHFIATPACLAVDVAIIYSKTDSKYDLELPIEADFDPSFDLIVGDLSFISQTLVLPALVPLLKPGGAMLMLVKPQFELQPGQVGKGGIVKDAALYAFVEQRIRDCYAELGLKVLGWFDSPITGGDGNREFFVYALSPTQP
jgi:23S rRNA (cytidine1920-2'-O)/16S rRNA (cytidine1409-2'-O)-methyltransferase